MKTRITQTRFWEDDTVESVSKWATYLWIFLLTNKEIGMTCFYKMPDDFMMHYTKLNEDELRDAKIELENTKKVFFYKSWVYIPNLERENKYKNSPKLEIPYKVEYAHVPKEIREYFNSTIDSTIDSLINSKTKNINSETKKEFDEDSVKKLENLGIKFKIE